MSIRSPRLAVDVQHHLSLSTAVLDEATGAIARGSMAGESTAKLKEGAAILERIRLYLTREAARRPSRQSFTGPLLQLSAGAEGDQMLLAPVNPLPARQRQPRTPKPLQLINLATDPERAEILSRTTQERKDLAYVPSFLAFLSFPAWPVGPTLESWLAWAVTHDLPIPRAGAIGDKPGVPRITKTVKDQWTQWAATRSVPLPPDATTYLRRSGFHKLEIVNSESCGIPYGIYPRHLIEAIATYVTQRKRKPNVDLKTVQLGKNFHDVIKTITGKNITYGIRGNRERFRRQFWATISSRIYWWQDVRRYAPGELPTPYDFVTGWQRSLLFELADPGEAHSTRDLFEWGTTLTLGERFLHDILDHSMQTDARISRKLADDGDCLSYDIYQWLSYRANGLKLERRIQLEPLSWDMLKIQFGSSYSEMKYFRRSFLHALRKVQVYYPKMSWKLVQDRSDKRINRLHITLKDTSVTRAYTGQRPASA